MTLDTLLYIAIGISILLLTGMGVLMPFNNWKYRIIFVFIALLASILIIIQGFRIQGATKQSLAHNIELKNLIQEQKETEDKLQDKINALLESNERMEKILTPFESLAKERFPNLTASEALENLKNDLSKLQSRTITLEQETKKTEFTLGKESKKQLTDGTFEKNFTLIPIGKNVIPIFKIACMTEKDAKILNFEIKGKTMPAMTEINRTDNNTAQRTIIRNMEPGDLHVSIITDKDTNLSCDINPLKIESR